VQDYQNKDRLSEHRILHYSENLNWAVQNPQLGGNAAGRGLDIAATHSSFSNDKEDPLITI